jgi:putative addiction module component (TIGR02574 family)
MKASTLRKIRRMPIVDRVRLVQAILDTIADDGDDYELNATQKAELGRRVRRYRRHPELLVPPKGAARRKPAKARRPAKPRKAKRK